MKVLDQPIDLGKVTCDAYVLGGTTDHITPWQGCYRSLDLLGGNADYVLSSSGHVQAIVNPPTNPKAKFRTVSERQPNAEAFLAASDEHDGTWWLHWADWLLERSTQQKNAPKSVGSKANPPIAAAPGEYVLKRSSK